MFAWILIVAGIAHAAPGDLDTSFGDGGWTFIEVPGYDDTNSAVLQPDGKIVVVATSERTMEAWRLLADGGPDPSFGGDGTAGVTFEHPAAALAVAVQTDGKIILAGFVGRRLAVVRLLSNGDVDTTFGDGDGIKTIRPVGRANAVDVAVLPDGHILLGAVVPSTLGPVGSALLRLTPEGERDEGFGTDGIVLIDKHVLAALAVDDHGSIILTMSAAWFRSRHFFVGRFNSDGTGDLAFGGDGIRRYLLRGANRPSDVVTDREGRILLALSGFSNRCFIGSGAVVRLTPGGDFDVTFSGDGIALRRCVLQRRLVIQPDDYIVAGGSIQAGGGAGEYKPFLARLTTAGELDLTFGEDGTVFAEPAEFYWSGTRGLLLQDDKIILLAGGNYQAGFAVGRFLAA